jgi:hypothetical protein
MAVRARTADDGPVMTVHPSLAGRVPIFGLALALLALLLWPGSAMGADWTKLERVTSVGGSRLDSLHQVASAKGVLHLVHPRLGSGRSDDKVVYQRSGNEGRTWSGERAIFKANGRYREVVPNLALDARDRIVAVAYRVRGPKGHTLFVRVSRNGGRTFGAHVALFSTRKKEGIGVPAVAIGDGVVAVAWTNRANGEVKIRTSRDDGRTFKGARTLGATNMSIDCRHQRTDGLVGLAANGRSIHVAWSNSGRRVCYADEIKVRTSLDRGAAWSPARSITTHDSFGWPELDARGKTVVATVQSTSGSVIVAHSERNGRNWREKVLAPPKGNIFSAADVIVLPHRTVVVTYVKERLRKGVLATSRLITRLSTDNGATWKKPKPVTDEARRLRLAPNVVTNDGRHLTIVVQSGQLDGQPRHIYATRLR